MDRDVCRLSGLEPKTRAAHRPHPCLTTEHGLSRGGSETDDERWANDRELEREPMAARAHLRPIRLVVNPSLPRRPPLEVLDGVRQVDVLLVDPSLAQKLAEEPPRGPDERPALAILDVTGLLADEHQLSQRALPEHRLRAELPELAATTVGGVLCAGRRSTGSSFDSPRRRGRRRPDRDPADGASPSASGRRSACGGSSSSPGRRSPWSSRSGSSWRSTRPS